MSRLKVVISAYACEPGRGSEPGIGWNWVREIARTHDVWVITRPHRRQKIEAECAHDPTLTLTPVYYDIPRWLGWWKRGLRGFHLHYHLWQVGSFLAARKLNAEIRFDVAHHITIGAYWKPALLALLPVPFVWGPVGGGEQSPPGFSTRFGLRGLLFETARTLAQFLGRCDPLVRLTAKRAALAVAATRQTSSVLQALGCRNVLTMSQVSLPDEELLQLANVPTRVARPFRLVSIGRLAHWKGFELALEAFARFHRGDGDTEYWIIGDGPELGRLKDLAARLGVAAAVRFIGAVPRARALEYLADCSALVHPSLHDSGGWVCVEALAAGRPVICLDWGGPQLIVTSECGVKIPTGAPEAVVAALADSFSRLASDTELYLCLSQGARLRASESFRWQRTCGSIIQQYESVAALEPAAPPADVRAATKA